MQKITDFDELKHLMQHYRMPDAISNNFMLPAELRSSCESGVMSYDITNTGLFLYKQRAGYKRLYFHLIDIDAMLPPSTEPLTTYLTYRGAPDAHQEQWLKAQGFRYENTIMQMSAESLNISVSFAGITTASPEEAEVFFGQYFQPLHTDLQDVNSSGTVIAVRDLDGAPVGMMLFSGKVVRLVAVAPEARGKGIASRLFAAFVEMTEALAGRYKLCVLEENSNAVKHYTKLGYKPDGLKSDLYILGG